MLKSKKRGAVELSMNTIIIVVIGITILTLGLRWVYNIFGGLEEQRKELSEATEEQIRKTFGESDEPLNLLTSTFSIEQNKNYDLSIGIRNTLSETHRFRYVLEVTDSPPNAPASQVLSWMRWDKSDIDLKSGDIYADTLSIDPKNAPLGIYKLKATLVCIDPGCDLKSSAPITMRIVAK